MTSDDKKRIEEIKQDVSEAIMRKLVISLSDLALLLAKLDEAHSLLRTITANSQHSDTRIPAEFVDKIRKALGEE